MTRAQAIPGEHVRIAMDAWTEPYWLAAKAGRLVAPRCAICGTFRMPPGPFCPECQSQQIDWAELSGEGVLFSFAVCHRSPFPGKVADFTYVPAVVSLPDAGGVRLVSNLIDVEPESIRIDMPLQVVFSEIAGGWKVPLFRPTRGS